MLQALIEKDWLAFGHKFTDRCAFVEGDVKEVSPVFTQFLDVVWQLQTQFPTCFEFNERFLIEIHTQLYQCKYGTFLGNCERERADLKLALLTLPLIIVHYYFPPTYNGGGIIICVAFFFYKSCQNSTLLLHSVNSSHHGAVGSSSAWQTRCRGFEPGLMRYIFSGKYPGA